MTKTPQLRKIVNTPLDEKIRLIAPCGINCGVCMAYLREKNKCPGCRITNAYKLKTRVICKIKACPNFRKNKVKYCFQCGSYPCVIIHNLDKRYSAKYNLSVIENLEHIKKHGAEKLVKSEKRKWTCKECGGVVCMHKGCCVNCGAKRIKVPIT